MGRSRQLFVGSIVVAALGAVGVISYAPERLPAVVATALGSIEALLPRQPLLIGVGVLVVLYGLWRRYLGGPHLRHEPLATVDTADESTPDHVGAEYTATVAQATAAVTDTDRIDDFSVVEPLRTVFIDLLVARGWPRERATDYVETGRWTDDRALAVFLGTDRAGDYPLWYRVYAWLLPERAFRRRVRAAVDHLTTYAAAPPGELHQPPSSACSPSESPPASSATGSSAADDSAESQTERATTASSDVASAPPTEQPQ